MTVDSALRLIEVPSVLVPKGSSTLPVVRSRHVEGGYHTAATNTARDNISPEIREFGMVCHVTATGKDFRLASNLTTWNEIAYGSGVTDPVAQTIADGLTSVSSVVRLFCAPSGDNVNGDGSAGNPWRSPSRAAQSLARAGELNGDMKGAFVVDCAPGEYPSIHVPVVAGAPSVTVYIVVGTTGIAPVFSRPLPPGVAPANPSKAGETLAAVIDHDVGAYDDSVFTPGSHWVHFEFPFGDGTTPWGEQLDCEASVSPNLRIGSNFTADVFDASGYGVNAQLRPYAGRISGNVADPDSTQTLISIVNDNPPSFSGGIIVYLIGFAIGGNTLDNSQHFGTITNVHMTACAFRNLALSPGGAGFENLYWHFESDEKCFHNFIGGANISLYAIFKSCPAFAGSMAEVSIQGVFRGRDGSGRIAYFGGVTGGRAPTFGPYELEWVDVEARGGGSAGILGNGAHFRLGNHGHFTVNGSPGGGGLADITALIDARQSSRIQCVNVSGRVAGPVFLLSGESALVGNRVDALVGHLDSTNDTGTIKDHVRLDGSVRIGFANVPFTVDGVVGKCQAGGPYEFFFTTPDATPVVVTSLPPLINAVGQPAALLLEVDAVALAFGVHAKVMKRRAAFVEDAGGAFSQIGATQVPVADLATALAASIDISPSSNEAQVVITGVAATPIHWHIRVDALTREGLFS